MGEAPAEAIAPTARYISLSEMLPCSQSTKTRWMKCQIRCAVGNRSGKGEKTIIHQNQVQRLFEPECNLETPAIVQHSALRPSVHALELL